MKMSRKSSNSQKNKNVITKNSKKKTSSEENFEKFIETGRVMDKYPRMAMRAACEKTGMNHSTFIKYINDFDNGKIIIPNCPESIATYTLRHKQMDPEEIEEEPDNIQDQAPKTEPTRNVEKNSQANFNTDPALAVDQLMREKRNIEEKERRFEKAVVDMKKGKLLGKDNPLPPDLEYYNDGSNGGNGGNNIDSDTLNKNYVPRNDPKALTQAREEYIQGVLTQVKDLGYNPIPENMPSNEQEAMDILLKKGCLIKTAQQIKYEQDMAKIKKEAIEEIRTHKEEDKDVKLEEAKLGSMTHVVEVAINRGFDMAEVYVPQVIGNFFGIALPQQQPPQQQQEQTPQQQ